MLNRIQLLTVGAAILLFGILYFSCETKPATQKAIEKTRALAVESTNIETLLLEAKATLSSAAATNILALETQMNDATVDSVKTGVLKELSSEWYQAEHPAIAAFYAEQVAEKTATENAWSIAGTTYTICLQRSELDKVRDFCTNRAIAAFESAISLSPDNVAHQTNLALVYTENPPQENPMKGILMLVDLNKKNPENIGVLNNLGRLAMKTGQFSKATERFGQALALEPNNRDAICMISQAYGELNQIELAEKFAAKCKESLQ
ncbi:MAG: tetratricopeptide repeat protein [Saprospiraceae bacterium]